jgi:hypothetical protein
MHLATSLTPAPRTAAGLRFIGLALLVATACTGSPLSATTGQDAGGADTLVPYPDRPDLASTVDMPDSVELAVARDGTGNGSVESAPGGIFCGGTCWANFAIGAVVTLSARPNPTATFAGWSGACSGAGTCTVTMDAAKSVTANFELVQHSLTVGQTGAGRGTMASLPGGLDCENTCSANFETGTVVILIATADEASVFTGWSGVCSGTENCVVTLDASKLVTANFDLVQDGLHVAKAGIGSGTVASSPSGISCGNSCAAGFAVGTVVTLVASPDGMSTFTGWSGACAGVQACTITIGTAKSVTANFDWIQYGLSITKSGTGSGVVASSPVGISSGTSCAATYGVGTMVTLVASPDQTSTFTGWSGACSGTGNCLVTLDAAKEVTANFDTIEYVFTVGKTGMGEGSITSVPSGIQCGGLCEAAFSVGSMVTLTASPTAASQFMGWSGACTGLGKCVVLMDSAQAATAEFASLHME